MPFSVEDKQAINLLRQTKRYGAKRLQSMFPSRQWSLGGLNKLLRKIDDTLNIRCEHFSLLSFCHVLVLKSRHFDCLPVNKSARHVLQCITAFQLRFTKNI